MIDSGRDSFSSWNRYRRTPPQSKKANVPTVKRCWSCSTSRYQSSAWCISRTARAICPTVNAALGPAVCMSRALPSSGMWRVQVDAAMRADIDALTVTAPGQDEARDGLTELVGALWTADEHERDGSAQKQHTTHRGQWKLGPALSGEASGDEAGRNDERATKRCAHGPNRSAPEVRPDRLHNGHQRSVTRSGTLARRIGIHDLNLHP